MPGNCAVASCKNTWRTGATKSLSFHKFPKDDRLVKVWISRCCRKDPFNARTSVICSEHFEDDQFIRDLKKELLGDAVKARHILKDDAVPVRKLPYKTSPVKSPGRTGRTTKRRAKVSLDELLADTTEASDQSMNSNAIDPSESNSKDAGCQSCTSLQAECDRLQKKLEEQLKNQTAERNRLQNRICFWRDIARKNKTSVYPTKVEHSLKRIFSPGQISCLQNGKKAIRWSKEDILHALELRTVSQKAYVYLRSNKQVPLPGVSTLRRWVGGFSCRPGISQFSLEILKAKGTRFARWDRVCVLSFDEVSVDQRMCYDAREDQVLGPYSEVLVFMIRGLMTKWKQPIYFDFNVTLSATLLIKVISELESIGYEVVACACDMAGGNRGLLSHVGATESAPYFSNPVDTSRNVWCFADVPHLLKLLRNHFLDHGICLPSGTVINKDTLLQLMDRDSDELKIVHKLTPLHLNAVGMERQKVRIAAQLFSRTTAAAIRYLFPDKMEMANFFELVNDAFDVLNTRVKTGHFHMTSAYGTQLNTQQQILDSMHKAVGRMRIVGKKTLLPFQKGFLMTITAVKGLFASVQALYNAQYLLTARLNQDCLENFFSQLRGIGHHYDHPTPTEVKHRFRLLIVARNSVDLNSSNVRRDADSNGDSLGLPLDDNDSQSDDYLTVNVLSKAYVFLKDADIAQADSLTELSADDIDTFFEGDVSEEVVMQSSSTSPGV